MKKFNIFVVLVVIAVMILTACVNQNAVETEDLFDTKPASSLAGNTEKSTVLESTTVVEESTTEKIESITQKSTDPSTTEKASTTAKQTTATTRQSTTVKLTTTKASQTTTTTTKKVTTTQKQTTTQKASTTHKETTTKPTTKKPTTTTKKSGLSKSDVEWVQSQGNAYIKSLGCTLNSDVRSFSGRIASKSYSDRNVLLSKVKDAIHTEYQECIDSGWKTVDMYCKIESTSDGNYYIYVMYG